jgi:hypothetical protein
MRQKMRLKTKQLWQLDNLLIKCTVMNTMEESVIESREMVATALENFLDDEDVYEKDLLIEDYEITTEKPEEFFTEIIRICFPNQPFTCQRHTTGRDTKKATDTKDYSGAKAYVFTLPTTTIRFCTKLFTRDPDARVIHDWHIRRDIKTRDPYDNIHRDELPEDYENYLVDTDDDSKPEDMDLVYKILDIIHTSLSHLEAACVKNRYLGLSESHTSNFEHVSRH